MTLRWGTSFVRANGVLASPDCCAMVACSSNRDIRSAAVALERSDERWLQLASHVSLSINRSIIGTMASTYSYQPSLINDARSSAPSADSRNEDGQTVVMMSLEDAVGLMAGAAVYAQMLHELYSILSDHSNALSSAALDNGSMQSQMSANSMSALSAAPSAAESTLAPSAAEPGQPKGLTPEQQQRMGMQQVAGSAPNNERYDLLEEALDAVELNELRKQADANTVSN